MNIMCEGERPIIGLVPDGEEKSEGESEAG